MKLPAAPLLRAFIPFGSNTSPLAAFFHNLKLFLNTSPLAAGFFILPSFVQAGIPIGINIGTPEFVDAVKTSIFVPVKKDAPIKFDAAGWPTTDFIVVLFDTRVHMPWNDNGKDPKAAAPDESGDWHLSCNGQAVIAPQEASMCEIQNLKYDSTSNFTTADIVVPANVNLLVLKFTQTNSGNPPGANGPGQGVKNLRIIRPGYPSDTKQVFTDRFLKGLKPFDTIRLMDFLSTNIHSHPKDGRGYPMLEEWSDRRLVTDARQNDSNKDGKFGVAWEYGIDLINQLKKNVWICVPVGASDDYVEQLATLLKANLDPNTIIYVEYSNEVWNWGFCQSWWNKAKADSFKDKNMGYVKMYAKRSGEIAMIFKKVFGDQVMITRIRPVLCWQMGGFEAQKTMCHFLESQFGTPKEYIYALACAPYVNSKNTSSVDACIAGMLESGKANAVQIQKLSEVAKSFGLHTVAYEGGPGLSGDKDLEFKLAANHDPRIGDVIKSFIQDDWAPSGGELFMQYSYCSGFGKYGSWGIVDPSYNLNNPKYQAYLRVLKSP